MRTTGTLILSLILACNFAIAQDTLYIYKSGLIVTKHAVADIDSIIFYDADTSQSSFICGTDSIQDYDGNWYQTVQIGNQCWLAENLKVTHYTNGLAIPHITGDTAWDNLGYLDKAWCYYDNSSENGFTYGALYTWAAAMNGAASSSTNPSGVQGVCPTGWHLPSNDEWKQLEMYLGMSKTDADIRGFRGTNEASKLAGNDSLWDEGALKNDTDFGTSGFTALPGGYRHNDGGNFGGTKQSCSLWSSTETSSTNALRRTLKHDSSQGSHHYGDKALGRSVRCVKD